jgi:hypothetical protein
MDDEYADIYYVDARNGRDHRPAGASPAAAGGGRQVTVPQSRTVVMRQVPANAVAYPPQVTYAQGPASGLLGNLTTGQVVEMVAQIFAALQGLPSAPVATKDVAIDVGNMVLYQSALASHAKRDEQLRTLGALVAKLVG